VEPAAGAVYTACRMPAQSDPRNRAYRDYRDPEVLAARQVELVAGGALPPDALERQAEMDQVPGERAELAAWQTQIAPAHAEGQEFAQKLAKAKARREVMRKSGRPKQALPGLGSLIERHKDRDKIDHALMHKTATVEELAALYGPQVTAAMLTRRRMDLRARLYAGPKQGIAQQEWRKEERAKVRAVDLAMYPLHEAQRLGAVATELVAEARGAANLPVALDALDRAGSFIDRYGAALERFGRLTGEIAPPGQVSVNQDNRSISILSLPRGDDPPEVIAAAERLVALPAPHTNA